MKKTALITGASLGIGEAFAHVFAKNNYDLILVARNGSKLLQLAKTLETKYKATVYPLAKDLSKQNAAEDVFTEVKLKNISVHTLVNNAGFGDYGLFRESKWQKQREMIDLNMMALTHLTHLFLPSMVAQKSGGVINVASTAAFQPGPLMSVYYATKAYVLFFTEGIANELNGTGVRVSALCPGPTESGFQQAAAMGESRLVKGKKMPSSYEVAEYGYRALQKNKTVAIHGTMNYFMSLSPRFVSRKMAAGVVRKMHEKK
jgi:short-subunit dehydrogenase